MSGVKVPLAVRIAPPVFDELLQPRPGRPVFPHGHGSAVPSPKHVGVIDGRSPVKPQPEKLPALPVSQSQRKSVQVPALPKMPLIGVFEMPAVPFGHGAGGAPVVPKSCV